LIIEPGVQSARKSGATSIGRGDQLMADRPRKRILLVEDEPGLVITLTDWLQSEGYEIGVARDGLAGLDRAVRERWDVILLDVMLPGKNGFDICRDLRQKRVATPIIMLTARGHIVDKVLGLKLGADDYLTKPFDMLELAARIEVQLRRAAATGPGSASQPYRFGDVVVDFRKAEVTRLGRPADLSAREFLLLKYFIEHREATLTRDELLNEVWGYHAMPSTRTVDVHVAWLRQKIEPNHGLGYKFVG
jgi:two-component system alkaline phosphatase synthesis response regulator PhoP